MYFPSLFRDYDNGNYTAVKGKRPRILLMHMWEIINALCGKNASSIVNLPPSSKGLVLYHKTVLIQITTRFTMPQCNNMLRPLFLV